MSDRVSQTVLLCEDDVHERLLKGYLNRCGLETRAPYVKSVVASQMSKGGNDVWVLNRFPLEVHACRQRHKRAKTLLVVMIDADKQRTVDERRSQLAERLTQAGYESLQVGDPVVVLVPKRNVETWIYALVGKAISEDENCKGWERPTKEHFRAAADVLFQWTRKNVIPGPTCVPSLQAALPEWSRIG